MENVISDKVANKVYGKNQSNKPLVIRVFILNKEIRSIFIFSYFAFFQLAQHSKFITCLTTAHHPHGYQTGPSCHQLWSR